MLANRGSLLRRRALPLVLVVVPLIAAAAAAPPPITGPVINIGEKGVATAEPLVPAPPTTPCVVQLYAAGSPTGTFDDYSPHPFSYAPPAACPGPWNKVVFKADYNVTAGRQYDRTASVWIGGVNIYFGTTQEPQGAVSPTWHVERDVTDLSAALKTAQPGNAIVYNVYDDTYNGSITGSAELDFYPATPDYPAAPVADQVLSLGSDPAGNYSSIDTDGEPLSKTFTLPTNIERAYLDVTPEAQSGDEFWYSCGPDSISSVTGCGGTGFREAEVTIDGQPAGFVPISPWVYTGGIDPYLWRPVPGVQTLDFQPFRVNLTPFAGLLSNGQPHAIAVSVVTGDPTFQNNSQRFDTAVTLLLFQDPRSAQVNGGLLATRDSGVFPASSLSVANDTYYYMDVASHHDFSARGYVDTSHGRVTTAVAEHASFDNRDTTVDSDTQYEQDIDLQTNAVSTSTTITRSGTSHSRREWSFPLALDYKYVVNPDGSSYQTTTVDQHLTEQDKRNPVHAALRFRSLDYHDQAADTLLFDPSGNLTGTSGQQATQSYLYRDSYARCYSRTVNAAAGAVTSVDDGTGCP